MNEDFEVGEEEEIILVEPNMNEEFVTDLSSYALLAPCPWMLAIAAPRKPFPERHCIWGLFLVGSEYAP